MEEATTLLHYSKVYYDETGEFWISFRVPKEVDVGDMGMSLWLKYVNYLKSLNTKPDAAHEALCLV